MTCTYHFHFDPGPDPIVLSWQQGWQVWQPVSPISVNEIQSYYSIDQLITWVNRDIWQYGAHEWHRNAQYSLPQLIKINRLYHDLQRRGNRKPLLLRSGSKKWDPLTGDTRLRAYELIDANALVDSILVTDASPNIKCDAIHTRLDFARACRSDPGTPFWLRVGEQGLEWYEMAADLDCGVTGQNFAEDAEHIIINYVMKQGSGFRFDRDWFCHRHAWIWQPSAS